MGQQPPLTPEQLLASPVEGSVFVDALRQEAARRYPDLPPVYQAIADGTLERAHLEAWIKDSYYYWDNLYRSVAGIFVKINVEDVRSRVLVKLVNVEGKDLAHDWSGSTTPAYEELWLRLAEGVGVSRDEVLAWKPYARTHFAVTTLALYSRGYEWSWLDGLAALYAGDLHHQRCLTAARAGLAGSYGAGESELGFFNAVLGDIEDDLWWEEDQLAYLCCTTERQHTAARAFRERLDIENQVAVGVWMAREAERGSGRVPTRVP
jgi:pyrroloquinoline quinone (PQQ) biosynthesis protein C